MENPNIADGDPIAHEVQVDLHMLRPLMLDDWSPQIPLADSSILSLTECHEEMHSSHSASAQTKSERAQARGPCAQ